MSSFAILIHFDWDDKVKVCFKRVTESGQSVTTTSKNSWKIIMVVTPLMWKSLDQLEKLFSYMWTNPIEWNSKNGRMEYTNSYVQLVPWLGSITCTFTIVIIPSFIITCSEFYGVVDIPLSELILTLALLLLFILGCILEIILLLFCERITCSANCLTYLERELRLSKLHIYVCIE